MSQLATKRKRVSNSNAEKLDGKNCLYLIGHNRQKITPYTHINCSDNPLRDLEYHNNTRPGEGVRETKKAAGAWRLLLLIYIPPSRQIDVEKLMNHWRAQHRTIPHRLAFGVQMASQMMLLCFVNENVFDMPEIKNKLPAAIREKIIAKLGDRTPTDAADDSDDDNDDVSNDRDTDKSTMQRAISRYIQKPDAVFSHRHSKNASTKDLVAANPKTKMFSKDFLDRLNTLYPVAIVTTTAASSAANRKMHVKKPAIALTVGTGESICFTRENKPPADDVDEAQEQTIKKKLKSSRGSGSRSSRRKLKFDNGALVSEPGENNDDDATNEAKQKRRRKSLSLVNKLAAIHREAFDETSTAIFSDKTLLRRYGDILCDNIADNTMRSKTKLSSGELSNNCLCGLPRNVDDEPVYMTLKTDEAPVRGFVCRGCQRFSAAYERISLDIETFRDPNSKQNSPERLKNGSSNAGTMDEFLESLIVSFRDPSDVKNDENNGEQIANAHDDQEDEDGVVANKRFSTTTPNKASAAEMPLTESELQPRLIEMRKKMSQSLLPQSDVEDSTIKNLFGI